MWGLLVASLKRCIKFGVGIPSSHTYDVKGKNSKNLDATIRRDCNNPVDNIAAVDVDHGWAWCVMVSTFIGCFLSGGMSYSFGIYYTEFVKLYPTQSITIGLLTGLPGSLILLVGPLGIYASEKIGYHWALAIGGLSGSLGFISSAYVHNLYILCLTLGFMIGFGSGMVLSPIICALKISFNRHYLVAHSGGISGIACGYLLFPFIYRYLIDNYGLAGSLYINGAIFLNTLVAATLLVRIPVAKPKLPTTCHRGDRVSGELALSTIPNIHILNLMASDSDAKDQTANGLNSAVDQGAKFGWFLRHVTSRQLKVWAFMLYAALEQAGTIILTVLIPYYSETLGISAFRSSSAVSFLGFGDFTGSLVVVVMGYIVGARATRSRQAKSSLVAEGDVISTKQIVPEVDKGTHSTTVVDNYYKKGTISQSEPIGSEGFKRPDPPHPVQDLNEVSGTVVSGDDTRKSQLRNAILFHTTVAIHVVLSLAYLVPVRGIGGHFTYLSAINFAFGMSYGIRLSHLTTFMTNTFGAENFTNLYGNYVMFAGWGSLFCIPLSSWLIRLFGRVDAIFYLICIIFNLCEVLLIGVSLIHIPNPGIIDTSGCVLS